MIMTCKEIEKARVIEFMENKIINNPQFDGDDSTIALFDEAINNELIGFSKFPDPLIKRAYAAEKQVGNEIGAWRLLVAGINKYGRKATDNIKKYFSYSGYCIDFVIGRESSEKYGDFLRVDFFIYEEK